MNRTRILGYLGFVILSLPFNAGSTAAAADYWVRGGRGDIEEGIVISGRDNHIAVSCRTRGDDDEEKEKVAIFFIINQQSPHGNKLWLKFDNNDLIEFEIEDGSDGKIHDFCSTSIENCKKIIKLFKFHNWITLITEDGKSIKFTLRGAAKAIPDCSYGEN